MKVISSGGSVGAVKHLSDMTPDDLFYVVDGGPVACRVASYPGLADGDGAFLRLSDNVVVPAPLGSMFRLVYPAVGLAL